MERRTLILGIHVLGALGLAAVGVFRISAGNTVGGGVSVVTALAIVLLGYLIAEREGE